MLVLSIPIGNTCNIRQITKDKINEEQIKATSG